MATLPRQLYRLSVLYTIMIGQRLVWPRRSLLASEAGKGTIGQSNSGAKLSFIR